MAKTGDHVVIRASSAGCFAGILQSVDGDIVVLTEARRLWYWDGAASLSELATKGVSKPSTCKFPAATEGEHTILGVCEIIPQTAESVESIGKVKPWSQH